MNKENTKKIIKKSIEIHKNVLENEQMIDCIEQIALAIIQSYQQGGKVLFCGNGGSAADAQHLAAELSGRFEYDRPPLSAEALHVNSSYMTAVTNDYSFELVYARMIEAKAKEGDVLVAISTSGNSKNIIQALQKAKKKSCVTVGFTGNKKGEMNEYCDYLIEIPSDNTARIQELHILIGHIICQKVETALFPQS